MLEKFSKINLVENFARLENFVRFHGEFFISRANLRDVLVANFRLQGVSVLFGCDSSENFNDERATL